MIVQDRTMNHIESKYNISIERQSSFSLKMLWVLEGFLPYSNLIWILLTNIIQTLKLLGEWGLGGTDQNELLLLLQNHLQNKFVRDLKINPTEFEGNLEKIYPKFFFLITAPT